MRTAICTGLLIIIVPLFSGVPNAQEAQPPPAQPPPLSILTQTPSTGATIPDRRPVVEIMFEDPKNLVDPSKVTMTIDDADVTSFLEISPGRVRYTPPGDLPHGQRRVQINLAGQDGQPLGMYQWSFVVKRFPWLTEGEAGLDVTASYQYTANKLVGTDPRHQTSTNLGVQSRAAEGGWVATLNGNIRYEDQYRPRGPGLGGDKVDVPNYLLALEQENFQFQTGNLVVNESQLAAPSLSNRGVQGKLRFPLFRSEVHAFATRAKASTLGNRNGVGFQDGENRVQGAAAIITPFENAQWLRLHGLYTEGQSPGPAKRSIEGGQRGQSWTWGATSSIYEGRIQGVVENSWSKFDSFLRDFVGPKHDEASRGQLQWMDRPFSLAGDPVQLSLVGVYDRVGTSFRTITNPGIAADRQGFNMNMGGAWRFVSLSFGGALFWDNIELLKLIPRTTSGTYMGTIGLNPPNLPSLSLNYSKTDQNSSHQPPAFGPRRIDNDLHRIALTTGYGRETWNINLGTGLSLLDNKTEPRQIPDNRTLNFTLGGSWRPAPTFSLGPSISYNQTRDKNRQSVNSIGTVVFQRVTTDSIQLSFATNWAIVPQELNLDLQQSVGLSFSDDNASESQSAGGSLRLSWNVEQYLLKFGRQVLSLRSNYNWQDSLSGTKQLNWGFFVGIDFFFPAKL